MKVAGGWHWICLCTIFPFQKEIYARIPKVAGFKRDFWMIFLTTVFNVVSLSVSTSFKPLLCINPFLSPCNWKYNEWVGEISNCQASVQHFCFH